MPRLEGRDICRHVRMKSRALVGGSPLVVWVLLLRIPELFGEFIGVVVKLR
jgi:hypothetical protein